MKNIIIKNKNLIKGPAQYRRHKPSGSGFVILFAVTLAAILLSITLGVSNIALKEIKFGTSAKDTNEAFFAADSGMELVLFNDKTPDSYPSPDAGDIKDYSEVLLNLGSENKSCASVIITKDYSTPELKTIVISKGHNNNPKGDCTSGPNTVERQLEVRY